jgi:hypothetical protein
MGKFPKKTVSTHGFSQAIKIKSFSLPTNDSNGFDINSGCAGMIESKNVLSARMTIHA